ncbi:MAG: hypothetical protein ACKOA8_19910, partial [Deltaproteobacteria bacterium]
MKKRLLLKFDYLHFSHYNSAMSFDSQDTLFSTHSEDTPLAQRSRPQDLSQIVGQTHFLNERFKRILES